MRYSNASDSELSNRACGLFKYLATCFSPTDLPRVLFSRSQLSDKVLASSFSSSLLADSYSNLSNDPGRIFRCITEHNDVRMIILDVIIDNLSGPPPTLSHYLLGMVGEGKGYVLGGSDTSQSSSLLNCFDAVLTLLNIPTFLTSASTAPIASRCYELIYRLCESPSTSEIARARLQSSSFWEEHTINLFADERGGEGELEDSVACICNQLLAALINSHSVHM